MATPTLTVTSPTPPSSTANVVGTGFPNRRTQGKLDGTIVASLRPAAGAFQFGAKVGTVARTQTLTIEQYATINGVASWREVAREPIVVQDVVVQPPVVQPPAPSAIRFGMAAHFMWQSLAQTITDLDRMKAAGMTYVRFDVGWRWGEPSKGAYDATYLGKLDSVLDACAARGFRTTLTAIETPGWANGGKGIGTPPTNPADYASFVGMLARRCGGRPGMVWEVWNEEDDPTSWATGPNAAAYAAMLKPAYAAIKVADPDCIVLTGGILANDTKYLEALYAAGAGDSFDGLAIHPYCGARAPGDTSDAWFTFKGSVPQFTAVLTAHGQGAKPIYITEMGWSTTSTSDATRATYLRDAVAIARGWTNVPGMAAYTLHQGQFLTFGLWSTSDLPTLSWNAYAAATK